MRPFSSGELRSPAWLESRPAYRPLGHRARTGPAPRAGSPTAFPNRCRGSTTTTTTNRHAHEDHGDLFDVALHDYRPLARLRHGIRRFLESSERMARAKGLTPQKHQLMLAVAGHAPGETPTIGYLAGQLLIQHHSAVGLVNRLNDQGLVERVHDSADRRQVIVRLTPRGSALLAELAASHRAELRSAGPALLGALSALIPDHDDRDDCPDQAGAPQRTSRRPER